LKIRDLEIGRGIALAPMAGFTDYAMRRICHELGADYAVTEMISAKATVFHDKKTARLGKITESEGAVGLQIFGSEPAVMAEAAAILAHPEEGVPPVLIDVNM
jgi:tRNA-dihydrouridine synthase